MLKRTLPGLLVSLVTVAVVGTALQTGPALAQRNTFGHTGLGVPEATDAGEWDGTWWYVNRDSHMAIWLRTVDGVPELKFQFMNLNASEGFQTDWKGHAEYTTRNATGIFDLRITERNANQIKGTWNWNLEADDSARRQRGEVTIYRADTGRQLVIHFDRYEFFIGRADEEWWQPVRQLWSFRKASKREVLWDELPF